MKFKMNLGYIKSIILLIILLGSIAIVGLDISLLVKAANGGSVRIAVSCVSLVAALIIFLLCALVLLNSYYKISSGIFIIKLGFISDKIKENEIVSLEQNSNTKDICLIVKGVKESDNDCKLKINIKRTDSDKFIDEIKKYYPSLLIELTNNDESNK